MPNFWFKFEWDKWLEDRELGRCSFETQGFWIKCICLMEESETWFLSGTVKEIANLMGRSEKIVARCTNELWATKAARIENEFGKDLQKNVKNQDFVKIVSRRLLKRHNLKEYNKLAKRKERQNRNVKNASSNPSKNQEFQSLRVLEFKREKDFKRLIEACAREFSKIDPRIVEIGVLYTLLQRNGSTDPISSLKYFKPEIEKIRRNSKGLSSEAIDALLERRREQFWKGNERIAA